MCVCLHPVTPGVLPRASSLPTIPSVSWSLVAGRTGCLQALHTVNATERHQGARMVYARNGHKPTKPLLRGMARSSPDVLRMCVSCVCVCRSGKGEPKSISGRAECLLPQKRKCLVHEMDDNAACRPFRRQQNGAEEERGAPIFPKGPDHFFSFQNLALIALKGTRGPISPRLELIYCYRVPTAGSRGTAFYLFKSITCKREFGIDGGKPGLASYRVSPLPNRPMSQRGRDRAHHTPRD